MSHAVCPKCHAVVGVSTLGPVPHNCWRSPASEPSFPEWGSCSACGEPFYTRTDAHSHGCGGKPAQPVTADPLHGVPEKKRNQCNKPAEPREFTFSFVKTENGYDVIWHMDERNDIYPITDFAKLHVIEKSAYDALKAERDATEKVYRMNREWIADAKEQIARLSRELEEAKGRIQREESARFEGERLLKAARAEARSLQIRNDVLRDANLRTYDGLTTRHDRYREALEAIAYDALDSFRCGEIAREALKEEK